MKHLLTSDQLIAHMETKGIKFDISTKNDARHFLENNNYYMKLASYRYNYSKYTSGPHEGQYINLDFAYLQELSTIDMYLRYYVMQMSLDIEHFLKVNLLKAIENNPKEDGYRLIQEFVAEDKHLDRLVKIQRHKSSDYCKGLIEKYYPYFPAWVYVELISFGDLSHLCAFYSSKYGITIADNVLLNSVRDIRNASAHSNCLINHLYCGNNNPHTSVTKRVKAISTIGANSREKKLKNKCLYDFTCLLFAYDEIVTSTDLKKHRLDELNSFFSDRMLLHKDWFKNNTRLTSSYIFAKKVLDNFI